ERSRNRDARRRAKGALTPRKAGAPCVAGTLATDIRRAAVVVRVSAPEPEGAEVISSAWWPTLLVPRRVLCRLCFAARDTEGSSQREGAQDLPEARRRSGRRSDTQPAHSLLTFCLS